MNPFSRFVYWKMNYHLEHHMFPQNTSPMTNFDPIN